MATVANSQRTTNPLPPWRFNPWDPRSKRAAQGSHGRRLTRANFDDFRALVLSR